MSDSSDAVFHYHQRTKHQLNAYARGPASMDWDDQPDPFRRFPGCDIIPLPPPGADLPCRFLDIDRPADIPRQPLTMETIGLLLELSFGLSAWKQYGADRWALRCNPSSGNLHPTEAYLICTDDGLLPAGVYHYVSHDHALERRCRTKADSESGEIYVGLSSIHWREAWKYGERAFRYCQHDVGHALAALRYAAACLGWSLELLGEVADTDLAHWLGLDRHDEFIELEHETPDLLCRLQIKPTPTATVFDADRLTYALRDAEWYGRAARLSPHHAYRWPIIDDIAAELKKPATPAARWMPAPMALPTTRHNPIASQLIRRRRSAQSFNAHAAPLPRADFYRILAAVLPSAKPPFDAWNWSPQVHLVLFVHSVEDVQPGLYVLPRDGEVFAEWKTLFSADYEGLRVDAPFEFYRLTSGNLRHAAKTLSCHQSIASDAAFSLGMLARFADNVDIEPWRYRRLFWECGLIGQILYLEAEAAGVRGTGIGCFFDDAVHGVLGLVDQSWQSLYHFTVGEPLEDQRLQTLPAYAHLR